MVVDDPLLDVLVEDPGDEAEGPPLRSSPHSSPGRGRGGVGRGLTVDVQERY